MVSLELVIGGWRGSEAPGAALSNVEGKIAIGPVACHAARDALSRQRWAQRDRPSPSGTSVGGGTTRADGRVRPTGRALVPGRAVALPYGTVTLVSGPPCCPGRGRRSPEPTHLMRSAPRLTAAAVVLLLIPGCSTPEPDPPTATLVEDGSRPFGTFDGVTYLRHTGIFRGETGLGPFRMPYEIVAPAAPQLGNGTVLLEPPHFTAGTLGRDAILGHALLFGSGFSYATVGFGEFGGNLLDPTAGDLLIGGRPVVPVGPTDSTGTIDEEILVQFAEALTTDSVAVEALGPVEHLYAYGASQTASVLLELRRAVQATDGREQFDLTLLHNAVWEPPLPPDAAFDLLDGDFDPVESAGRVFFVEAEADRLFSAAEQFRTAVDVPGFRVYEVAGAAHAPTPDNPLDHWAVARALFVAGDRWVRSGTEPPPSTLLEPATAGVDPLYGFETGIARDDDLNARGGVRLPDLAVGRARFVAMDTTTPTPGNETGARSAYAGLTGSMVDLACEPAPGADADTPRFASHDDYATAFGRQADSLVERGFLLPTDATVMKARAADSDVGKPETCSG